MLRKPFCVLAVFAAGWSVSAASAPSGTSDVNAALFGLRESAVGVHLSPSGNQVAYVAPAAGGGAIAWLDHQLDDSDARIEMLTAIGKILDKSIGH